MAHWSERYSCSCGASFRSYAAEARHRHNFPLLCRKPKAKPKQSCLGCVNINNACEVCKPLLENILAVPKPKAAMVEQLNRLRAMAVDCLDMAIDNRVSRTGQLKADYRKIGLELDKAITRIDAALDRAEE